MLRQIKIFAAAIILASLLFSGVDSAPMHIAAAMGTSEGAVESLLVRALDTLRRELAPEPGAG